MLRVMIELVPFGQENEARVIEQLLIANVSLKDGQYSDYEFAITDDNNVFYGSVPDHWRPNGAWELVRKILAPAPTSYFPETNTQKQLAERFTK